MVRTRFTNSLRISYNWLLVYDNLWLEKVKIKHITDIKIKTKLKLKYWQKILIEIYISISTYESMNMTKTRDIFSYYKCV